MLNSLKIGNFFIIFFIFCFLFSSSLLAQTATFSLESTVKTPQKGEVFLVQIFVNTPSEINTVFLELSYPSETFLLEDVSFTGSVLPNIVERDTKTAGRIKLTSFTVTPFVGDHGLYVTLKFKAQEEGGVNISLLPSSKIHLADGKGTDSFNYQASQKSLVEPSLPPTTPVVSPAPTVPTSPTPMPGPKTISEFISNLFKPAEVPKEGKITLEDQELEKVLFPEKGVTDLTKTPGTGIQKTLNQLKTNKTFGYLLITLLTFIFGLVIFLLRLKRIRKK